MKVIMVTLLEDLVIVRKKEVGGSIDDGGDDRER